MPPLAKRCHVWLFGRFEALVEMLSPLAVWEWPLRSFHIGSGSFSNGSCPPVQTAGDREPHAGFLDVIHGLDRCIDARTARLHRICALRQDSSTLRERVNALANRTRQWLSGGEAVCTMPQKRGYEEQLDSGIVCARCICWRCLSP